MRIVFMCFSIAVLLAGCASTQEKTPKAVTATLVPPAVSASAEDYQPVERTTSITQISPTESVANVLKNPSALLSTRSVYFDFDRDIVQEQYRLALSAHARFLIQNPSANMLIQGNADERGTREYNLVLGQKRADAVKRILILLGARDSQIESVSLGEEHPTANGHYEAAYAQNRRADILYRFQDVREF